MADLKKTWSVTYTKHVKQKRKVYQDGFLQFHSSKNKVILYDDCKNVLDSRFVKKDDTIAAGEILAFDFYLVNIGDLQEDHDPVSKSNIFPAASKINRTCESFQSPKFGIKKKKNCLYDLLVILLSLLCWFLCLLSDSRSELLIHDFERQRKETFGAKKSKITQSESITEGDTRVQEE